METIFVDSKDRKWNLTLNLAGAKRVDNSDFKEIIGEKFSILDPGHDIFMSLLTNTSLTFAVIWAIVQPQVKKILGIDPETDYNKAEAEFLEGINGEAIERGRKALWETLANFFPPHRTTLLSLMEQFNKAQEKMTKAIQGVGGDLEKKIEQEIETSVEELKKKLLTPA